MKTTNDPKMWLMTLMLVILGILILAAAFFVLQPTFRRFSLDYYYPVFKLIRGTEAVLVDQRLLMQDKKELAAAVTLLQEQNSRLAAENAVLMQNQAENAELRSRMGLQPPPSFKIVHAEVMTRDPVTWQESFVIDHGSTAGIKTGDLVIATAIDGDGHKLVTAVVGRVGEVSNHTSVILTLYNNGCTLGGYLEKSEAYGMLAGDTGNGARQLRISCLPPDKKYAVGELVLTSRYSRYFPEGIHIGRIAANPDGSPAIRLDSNALSAEGLITPVIDISRVRFVTVLTGADSI